MMQTQTGPSRRALGRPLTIGLGLVLIAGLGGALALAPPLYNHPTAVAPAAAPAEPAQAAPLPAVESVPLADPHSEPRRHAAQAREHELRRRFDEAVAMLHARRYDYAIAALHRVLELSPRLSEAHVNMGYALLGLRDFAAARDFFAGAIELNPRQANAYYGLAIAREGLGELPEAVGAMRAYLHLSPAEDGYHRKARAALWEWEAQLARSGPPAPTGPGGGP